MKGGLSFLLLVTVLLPTALSYPFFQERLPNGNFVPHPCLPNFVWKGAGHEALLGGGPRNPFGRDFAENGFKWDSCLCEQDSDGDGRSNGEELGDPDCTWSPPAAPKHKFGLTHPGICEPLNSTQCQDKNTFAIDCSAATEFECDATESPDVRNITFRFPETSVPPKETTYICMTFDLPSDQEYHMIAYEPMINNPDVMHHIVIYGCTNDPTNPLSTIDTPAECGMAAENCQDIIALWAVGGTGVCLPEEYGFKLGDKGYKTVMMQMHWTNPTERTDYVDSSGMTLYYTPLLRNNSAEILETGQFYLQIPPGRLAFPQDSVCSSDCTSKIPQSVYISDVFFHMHYLGHSGYTELWRDGAKVTDLIRTDDYDYDRPELVRKTPAIEFRPGDYLKTRCNFNSLNRGKITFYGEGSFEEMCISFIILYPAVGLKNCASYGESEFCNLDGPERDRPMNDTMFPSGNYTEGDEEPDACTEFFESPDLGEKIVNLYSSCDENGAVCRPGCQPAIDAFRESPCFQGTLSLQVESYLYNFSPELKNLRYYLRSCDGYDIEESETSDEDDNRTENEVGGSKRYDPDQNGLPAGGICPFGGEGGDRPTSKAASTGRMKMDEFLMLVVIAFTSLAVAL